MNPGWSLHLWPSLRNAAWRRAAAADAVLGDALQVSLAPRAVTAKVEADALAPLKSAFLVDNLAGLPSRPIPALYTYWDMEDAARCGENFPETRLYQWLMASLAAGRPVVNRGVVLDSEARIRDYCRSNLELFRSLQQNGYRYSGPDEICFGIAADGKLLHMRRGTHRLAAAYILELPSISGRITHVDRAFAQRVAGNGGKGVIARLGAAIQELTRQTFA